MAHNSETSALGGRERSRTYSQHPSISVYWPRENKREALRYVPGTVQWDWEKIHNPEFSSSEGRERGKWSLYPMSQHFGALL